MDDTASYGSANHAADWLRCALGLRDGQTPFPWQSELLRRFVAGEPVSAIDIPTGLGKTATMAVWLVARALGAPLPRRLVYVVDRRAVVDQATNVAESLRAWVAQDRTVADALGLGMRSLPISTLRGQHVDNREWLEDPSAPAIIVGTVDMVGSRLLFSGYGVSTKMRPYHAGLLGVDSLVVLDEAHLTPAFERLVEAIEYGTEPDAGALAPRGDSAQVVPRIRLVSLSATGRIDRNALVLSDADLANEIVTKRLRAKKRLILRDPVPSKELPEHLADAAWSLCEGRPVRVIVFANSRDVAQKVSELLTQHEGVQVELFVGARRVYERTRVAAWLVDRGFVEDARGSRAAASSPAFLVATSAAEVGVDIDADHMVSDLVAWERMVQRLGRVNRRGEGDAQVIVIPEPDAPDADRLGRVHALLLSLPQVNGGHDASPGAVAQIRSRFGADIEAASSLVPLHPPLSRAGVESWAMTALEEHTGRPAVQPWIRGWIDEEDSETAVVFRRELPVDGTGRLLADRAVAAYLEAAPPHLKEVLETETRRVVEWFVARNEEIEKVRTASDESVPPPLGKDALVALVLDGTDVVREVRLSEFDHKPDRVRLHRQLAGTTVLVDVRIGGLNHGLLDRAHPEATDVGDETADGVSALPFRVSRTSDPGLATPATGSRYREEARLCIAETEGVETDWIVIETLADETAQSEEGRSVSPTRAQLLDEHEEWTAREARALAMRIGLIEPFASVFALAARLHDEGKRVRTWQRAFGVSDGDQNGGHAYGKTTMRPNLALLGRYRHELGSLLCAEKDARVRALSPELRDLCLHLIVAHHGFGRPLLRTDGAEWPPSMLVGSAQQIALRYTRLEKAWGPWGLAWWEALLRAADQRASRLNDTGGSLG